MGKDIEVEFLEKKTDRVKIENINVDQITRYHAYDGEEDTNKTVIYLADGKELILNMNINEFRKLKNTKNGK